MAIRFGDQPRRAYQKKKKKKKKNFWIFAHLFYSFADQGLLQVVKSRVIQ